MGAWSHGTTSVSTNAVQIVGVNDPPRSFLIIQNVGTTTAYLGASNVVSASGFPIASNGISSFVGSEHANEPLYVIAAGSVPFRILSKA